MILDTIAESTRIRVTESKRKISLEALRREAEEMESGTGFPFYRALAGPEISFICEVKKASPSKGIIAADFPYLQIAREYQEAGAAAVSVLTEPEYFKGCNRYLQEIALQITIPVLRKDFTVDPYQIYEAKTMGASAVLLICTLLETSVIREYLAICHELGLSALVEAHNENEVESALQAEAAIIGVNNRNLQTFQVDVTTSSRLRAMVPGDRLFVSESGISGPQEIAQLQASGVNGVLIGEALMRCTDKRREIARLRGYAPDQKQPERNRSSEKVHLRGEDGV